MIVMADVIKNNVITCNRFRGVQQFHRKIPLTNSAHGTLKDEILRKLFGHYGNETKTTF